MGFFSIGWLVGFGAVLSAWRISLVMVSIHNILDSYHFKWIWQTKDRKIVITEVKGVAQSDA